MKRLSSLSIFFPAYNDESTIPDLIKRAEKTAKKLTNNFEIIIINDGSSDNIVNVVESLTKTHPHLRIITHRKNQGYGSALISGFRASSKDWIFYTDGDGQYDPTELTALVHAATESVDVVNGYKIKRQDPLYRIVIGTLYNLCIQAIFRPPIKDIDCDFRLIRRKFLKKFTLKSHSGAICLELIMNLKRSRARFVSIPVHHYPRHHGHSQFFSLSSIYKTAQDIFILYRRMN